MCWLGVTLGSMAILMIRHLTGGGWGMVIRRILGAAMRTVPLLAVLFIPVIVGMKYLYIWARPLSEVTDKHLRERAPQKTSPKPISQQVDSFSPRRLLLRYLEICSAFLLSKWSKRKPITPAPRQHPIASK